LVWLRGLPMKPGVRFSAAKPLIEARVFLVADSEDWRQSRSLPLPNARPLFFGTAEVCPPAHL
jgi:hypothetical protein